MTSKIRHIHWLLAGTMLACCGCPSANNNTSTSAVPIEAALAQSGNTAVLAATPAPTCVQVGQPASNVHRAMFEQLNAYRIQLGLQPLVYSKTLEAAANAMAKDLYARNFFDHTNPDGKDPGQRALDAHFCHKYVGENIAAGQTSVTAVMDAWKNSPHHNDNMIDTDYAYIGMGYYVDPNGRQYWVQEFAFDASALSQ